MPIRVQLSRKKGWRKPDGAVVVSRPTKWGNPHDWQEWRADFPKEYLFEVGSAGRDIWCKERAQEAFAEDLRDGTLKLPVEELRGKDLACWCAPSEACHADILLKLANV